MKTILGISLAVLATVMLAGSALAITYPAVTNPPTGAIGSPILSVSFQVNNDEDSGILGYWALDSYTKTITVWQSGTTGTDVGYVGYSGTFCTFASALSPQNGTNEPNDGCGTFTGGKDVTLTSSDGTYPTPLTTASPTSPEDIGGTKADIVLGTYSAQSSAEDSSGGHETTANAAAWDWHTYYFGSTAYAETAWSFTYTLSNGATTQWVNDANGNTGDIITNPGIVTVAANVICNSESDCSAGYGCVNHACVQKACGLSAMGDVQFGSLVPGATVQSGEYTTVTNTGNVAITPLISGDYWYGSNYATQNDYMPIGATEWTISPWTALTPLTSSGTAITTLSPLSIANVYYQLTVPAHQTTDSYTQTITFSAGC